MTISDAVGQYQQLCKYGAVPDVFRYLADHSELSLRDKERIVLIDQMYRWNCGQPLSVEEYLTNSPDLSSNDVFLLELVVTDHRHRKQIKQEESLDELLARYPQLEHGLRHRLAMETEGRNGSTGASLTAAFVVNQETQRIGRFRLDRLLGEGGFAKVWLAQDEELKRQVAIKLQAKGMADEDAKTTYLLEAQTIASLDHPHIVPIYDVGQTEDGKIYIVMKYFDGGDLTGLLTRGVPPFEDSVKIVAAIARALGVAHDRRLIHRDIKPANILFDAEICHPYVTDFGLAVKEEDYLQSGKVAGTPAYMSPEQARGEGHRLDGRSDLFSLGVVLYELLTGKQPFTGGTMYEVLHNVISTDPSLPQSINTDVPTELQRICLKALCKRASERYATAVALAEDLEHWVSRPEDDRPVNTTIIPKGLRSFDAGDASFFLDLLPGPRNRDGLPESIGFWKTRIEEKDAEGTFSVGLIYGPSGCGKSSLVKAGLLPNLSSEVTSVYIEATADDTEDRICRNLQKRLPELNAQQGLVEMLTNLRRNSSKKVLIVLDQFEQWLHAKGTESDTELVRALRQCDAKTLQAICLVRDDFAMAASRFMRELEHRIIEGHNFATVDLFDYSHAERVLAIFGQAFQKLPPDHAQFTKDQEKFLKDVVSGLASEGKVVSVRIALFAEMVKDKVWSSETLERIGGTQGVGVNFLEETFGSRSANPNHLRHQIAARSVLRELLPESGKDIKGNMRSNESLFVASGYSDAGEFHDLLRVLDGELRLITPTDPEGTSQSSKSFTSKFYQLTHDYLVPSLRTWLTQKQKETAQGRAELLLDERSALWNDHPEEQRLPSWHEFLTIRAHVDSSSYTEPQRRMIEEAGKHFAKSLVDRLLHSDINIATSLADQCSHVREWIEPLLVLENARAEKNSRSSLNINLALLQFDDSRIDALYTRMLEIAVDEFSILRDYLAAKREQLVARLWDDAQNAEDKDMRLRAAAALAKYDPLSSLWDRIQWQVAQALTLVKPETLGDWIEEFRSMRKILKEPLSNIFRSDDIEELQSALCTSVLADFSADDPNLLSELLLDANPKQFSTLFPVLERHGNIAIEKLEATLAQSLIGTWPTANRLVDSDPAKWDNARKIIAEASGMIVSDYAYCTCLPLEKLDNVLETLSDLGFRPLSIRPYKSLNAIDCAVTWTRDDAEWEWLHSTSASYVIGRNEELSHKRFVPVDVSIVLNEMHAPVYTVVWRKSKSESNNVRLRFFSDTIDLESTCKELVQAGFNCVAADCMNYGDEKVVAASIWSKELGQATSTTRIFHDNFSEFWEHAAPSLLMTDVHLNPIAFGENGENKQEAKILALWNVDTSFESRITFSSSEKDLGNDAVDLASEGYRPVKVSASTLDDNGTSLATLWHRPLVPDSEKDRLAQRQANAAVALLRLNRGERVWDMFRHQKDPRTRSYLIHRLRPLGADPKELLEQLIKQADDSTRRGLILGLGEFSEDQFSASDFDRLVTYLLDLLVHDADSGVHAAAKWTLDQWGRRNEAEKRIRELGDELSTAGNRHWYVNNQEQSFVVIPTPGLFMVGSPPWEYGREGGPHGELERMRYASIEYSFSIMSCPVTVEQFLRFRPDFPYRAAFSQNTRCPINNVSWYDAAAYCNWLNEQEGIPEEEWCYRPNENGEYASGMRIVENCLALGGYRLPSDIEWEYACRAGSVTSRYYGESSDLDNYYAWTAKNSCGSGLCPVGSFKPNDFGIFDMLGNVIEWLHDVFPKDDIDAQNDSENTGTPDLVTDFQLRSLRPSNYAWFVGDYARCAESKIPFPANAGILNNGFRVGRTIKDFEDLENDRFIKMRGGCFCHSSHAQRACYGAKYKPNFAFPPFGLRPARTIKFVADN